MKKKTHPHAFAGIFVFGKSFFLASATFAPAVFATAAIASEQAHSPTVPDGATDVDPEVTLSCTGSCI